MDPFAVEVGNGEVATVVPFEHGPADWGRGLTPVVKPKLLGGGTPPTALTCENADDSKVFLHRKSATMTGYHDGSLRWSAM